MAYQHDIFISYRRLGETRTWIESIYLPLFVNHLSQELGRNPDIFLDSMIDDGDSWPNALGNALSSSKVIIILWTKKYLESKWCSCEIGHMLEREMKCGYRTGINQTGLIFPTIIHDGETMPINLSTIQAKIEMQQYFKLTLNKDGQRYTEFEDKIKSQVETIASAIDHAPVWQQDWQIEAVNSFVQQLYIKEATTQNQPPKFS